MTGASITRSNPTRKPAEYNHSSLRSSKTFGDRVYQGAITAFAIAIPLLLIVIAYKVMQGAWPAFREFRFDFFLSSEWDVANGKFGAGSAIYGTVATSVIALVIAAPLAIGAAIFLSELAPSWIRQPLAFLVDLLAAIPSIVYGLWGIFFLIPLLRSHVIPFLQNTLHLDLIPFFAGPTYGPSIFAAGVILAIMILPYISAVSREVFRAVPQSQREAALALGCTRWEVIWRVVMPYAKSGIVGGVILGLGRALGETMAVTMLIGNSPRIATSLFAPGYTLSSRIANEFNEASNEMHLAALMATGATLFAIAIIVNLIARLLVGRVRKANT